MRCLPFHRHLLAATAAVLMTAGTPAQAVPFTTLTVFGDSLSDTGNIYSRLFGFYPADPYYQGRFSNGLVAVEWLSAGLGLQPNQFFNFAFGGAKTGQDGVLPDTGMKAQVTMYKDALAGAGFGSADSNGLYVVWGGGNDLRDLAANPPATPQAAAAALGTVVGNLAGIVNDLYQQGARHFLLPNMPDLGLTPESLRSGNGADATALSLSFNQALGQAYDGLAALLPGERFYRFDTFAAQHQIVDNAAAFGFSNLSEPCFDESSNPATLCAVPNSHFFWDDIHPTAAVHYFLGAGMLAAVPEPQSMLLMALGVAVLAGLGRRRST